MAEIHPSDVELASMESDGLLEKQAQEEYDHHSLSSAGPNRDGAMTTVRTIVQKMPALAANLLFTTLSILKPALLLDMFSPKKTRDTAWMDGMRGFACLCVYSHHYTIWSHRALHLGWAVTHNWGWEGQHYFILFPGIRLLFTGGNWGVTMFYALSGYVLSLSALQMVHAGNIEGLANRMISSLFRRWLRLFIPLFATTFLWITSWHVLGIRHVDIEPMSTYWGEVTRWAGDIFDHANIFTEPVHTKINDHAWSIPVEFRGSIVVFTACIAFARFQTKYRLLCSVVLIFYFWYCISSVGGAWNAVFCSGMLLCDLNLLIKSDQLPKLLARVLPRSRQWIHYPLIIIGSLLSSVLAFMAYREQPLYNDMPARTYFLRWIEPRGRDSVSWFWDFWAVLCFMIAVPRIPWMRASLESSVMQYFGRISYMFYLIHGPVMWTFSERVFAMFAVPRDGNELRDSLVKGWLNLCPLPTWGIAGLEVNYLVSQVIVFSFTVWLADLATRLIDDPSVDLGYWLFKRGLYS